MARKTQYVSGLYYLSLPHSWMTLNSEGPGILRVFPRLFMLGQDSALESGSGCNLGPGSGSGFNLGLGLGSELNLIWAQG